MRKVIFKINDKEYFKKDFKRQNINITEEQTEGILKGLKIFKAIYILYGNEKQVDRYELIDYDGNKMNINDLNGYEKGVVLNDCYAYFIGGKYCFDSDSPCGVVEIIEEEV